MAVIDQTTVLALMTAHSNKNNMMREIQVCNLSCFVGLKNQGNE